MGIFASTGKDSFDRVIKIAGLPDFLLNSKIEDENYALFANMTYHVSDSFRLHTGLRLDYVDKRVDRELTARQQLQASPVAPPAASPVGVPEE